MERFRFQDLIDQMNKNDNIIQKARIYLKRGHAPPKGAVVHRGDKGGIWYEGKGGKIRPPNKYYGRYRREPISLYDTPKRRTRAYLWKISGFDEKGNFEHEDVPPSRRELGHQHWDNLENGLYMAADSSDRDSYHHVKDGKVKELSESEFDDGVKKLRKTLQKKSKK